VIRPPTFNQGLPGTRSRLPLSVRRRSFHGNIALSELVFLDRTVVRPTRHGRSYELNVRAIVYY
jgi:hypothetical protein